LLGVSAHHVLIVLLGLLEVGLLLLLLIDDNWFLRDLSFEHFIDPELLIEIR